MSFTNLERRWAQAIFETMYPRGAHERLPLGIADTVGSDRVLDEAVAHWPWQALLALRAAVVCVALAPLFVLGAPRTILGLDEPRRAKLLARLYESDVYLARQFVVLLKTLAGIHHLGHARVRDAVAPRGAPEPALLNQLVRGKRGAAVEVQP